MSKKEEKPENIMEKPASDTPPKTSEKKEEPFNAIDLSPIMGELKGLKQELNEISGLVKSSKKEEPAKLPDPIKEEPKKEDAPKYRFGDEFDIF